MWIEKLQIQNCRILKNVELELSPHFNIIYGDNGSGKTSFLEALSLLSKGRSFRTSRISEVINNNKSSVLVSSSINNKSGITSQIGIEKSSEKTQIRINKKDVYTQSELSRHLPITVIHPDSIKLITGSPAERRSFIDWLSFYLHNDFHNVWKKYQHILKQRNSCLRNVAHRYALDDWTKELIKLQPIIHEYRSNSLEKLQKKVNNISSEILGDIKCEIDLKSGFPQHLKLDKETLTDYYAEKLDFDIKLGRTQGGVHRADLIITMNGISAIQSASRGQLKLIVITLLLAQNNTIHDENNSNAIILIDDIAAELDADNKKILINYLLKLEQQLIITTPASDKIEIKNAKMFHVKQGEITINPSTL